MVKLSQSYQLGGFCICLDIVSYQDKTIAQLKERLASLSSFQCTNNHGETWFLTMSDSVLSISLKNRSSKKSGYQKYFFAGADDPRILNPERILFSVMLLATRLHVRHNSLCLHGAAVSRNRKGFLFLGEGGAGKSTIAMISAALDIPVLAEDRVFLQNQKHHYLLAAGPHPTTEYTYSSNLRPGLYAIFVLVKDNKDFLIPLSQSDAGKYLFAAFLQNSASGFLPADEMRLAFKTISNVARQIPTYVLHFRKSPDFWKLIDEQFPD